MAFWILKTEPDDYCWLDLVRDKRTVWDGVKNNQALIHLRTMQVDDQVFIYHTGKERAIVAVGAVASHPYPDPHEDDERFVVVDVVPDYGLDNSVSLKTIKAEERWHDWYLVRQSRLSVVPCTQEQWDWVLEHAK